MVSRSIHDLPRLAKESGFHFHSRSKKVEWAQMAQLDLEDITRNQKFELLEEKIELVENWDLDQDITQVLNRDLVQLFRLAQLSVSYLRHCQLYLDRCVAILQEQLSAALKECETLKDARKCERDVFECKICEKTFLTASYRESHERRRHGHEKPAVVCVAIQTEPEHVPVPVRTVSTEQQTDPRRTVTSETQTVERRCLDVGVMTEALNKETKSDPIERLGTLSVRLEPVEARAQADDKKPSGDLSESNGLGSVANIPLLLQNLMPLLQSQQLITSAKKTVAEVQVIAKQEEPLIDFATPTRAPLPLSSGKESQISKKKEKKKQRSSWAVESQSHSDSSNEEDSFTSLHRPEPAHRSPSQSKIPNRTRRKIILPEENNTNHNRPIPNSAVLLRQKSMHPESLDRVQEFSSDGDTSTGRQVKSFEVKQFLSEEAERDQPKIIPDQVTKDRIEQLSEPYEKTCLQKSAVKKRETGYEPIKKQESEETRVKEPELKPKYQATPSSERTIHKNKKSFFKNLVRKNSPKLKELHQTLKRSWSNLYDSKFSSSPAEGLGTTGLLKNSEIEMDGEPQAVLELKLRELGVDPNWSGIPDDTLDRVMAALQHYQTNKAKTVPGYLQLREHLESMVEHRLEAVSNTSFDQGNTPAGPDFTTPKKPEMYDIDSEAESEDLTPTIIPTTTIMKLMASTSNGEDFTSASKFLNASAIEISDVTPPHQTKDVQAVAPVTLEGSKNEKQGKKTDLSMFEIEPETVPYQSPIKAKSRAVPIPPESSDSSEQGVSVKNPMESGQLKSAILRKKDEGKKRVVFADNFELETNHQLLDVTRDNSSSSLSSSDWDIPMP